MATHPSPLHCSECSGARWSRLPGRLWVRSSIYRAFSVLPSFSARQTVSVASRLSLKAPYLPFAKTSAVGQLKGPFVPHSPFSQNHPRSASKASIWRARRRSNKRQVQLSATCTLSKFIPKQFHSAWRCTAGLSIRRSFYPCGHAQSASQSDTAGQRSIQGPFSSTPLRAAARGSLRVQDRRQRTDFRSASLPPPWIRRH
ncbi:MAG: hypothetical protein JWL65_2239 [Gammaproteobacteria bacterium]|nr:hypothetical protein [Gammaproteobacteria bacterium]